LPEASGTLLAKSAFATNRMRPIQFMYYPTLFASVGGGLAFLITQKRRKDTTMRKKILAGLAGLMLALFAGQFIGNGVSEANSAESAPTYKHTCCGACGAKDGDPCH
jgi:hypothetical protein